ncbi:MAG: COX15/CtaA family protein [Balneolaceae bacterium]|nr:COX15/CtaA family protein [Balneolaceae bacterium]
MNLNTYQKVAFTTVLATIFLIFVGGLVRASGAGLGCPDWPKCFGLWIPPTTVSELPAGFDPSQFNVLKTWTEYINRLIGVVIGLLILSTFVLSFRYRKSKPAVFYSSTAAFIMVLVQGWLGGQVVLTGLSEWLITLHMMLAMCFMAVLLYAAYKATSDFLAVDIPENIRRWLFWSGIVLLVCTLGQTVVGTQVREAVDLVKNANPSTPREAWLDLIGSIDEYHRTLSWSVFIPGLLVGYLGGLKAGSRLVKKLSLGILGVILFQIALGAGLYYLGMPPAYQVFHLVGVAVLICLEFLLLLVVKNE